MKKLLIFILCAFLLFFLVRQPVESAQLVKTIAGGIADGFTAAAGSLSTFVQELF